MFWLTVTFVSCTNIPIAFLREEDKRTASTLRLASLPFSVFTSKWLQSAILTSSVSLLLLALAAAIWGWNSASWKAILTLALVAILISFGLAASETLLAAMISKAKMRSSLMGVISFPILLPILIPAIKCTADCIMQESASKADILWFVVYLALVLSISSQLFEHIWRA